jgi:glycogen operon protein
MASVNFVTAHDGFTLRDLTSYRHKHNEANGEANKDGHNANYSINCGIEGPTDDPAINAQRGRLARALLAVTLLAQGTPMLAAGDELGRTQRGNNNAYCQDSDISWLDWQQSDATLTDFVARLIALRQRLPALRQTHWLSDRADADGRREVDWHDLAGHQMTPARWHDADRHGLVVKLAADGAAVLLIFNAEPSAQQCLLPRGLWRCLLDSSGPTLDERSIEGALIEAPAQSVLVLVADG